MVCGSKNCVKEKGSSRLHVYRGSEPDGTDLKPCCLRVCNKLWNRGYGFLSLYHVRQSKKEKLQLSREKTEAWNSIHKMCEINAFEEKELEEKAKAVLGIYRIVCWSAAERANRLSDDIDMEYSSDLSRALVYLEEFAPEETRQKLESNVRALFETKWLVDLVDTAMLQVKEFPAGGDEYFEILNKCFLTKWSYTPEEIQELTSMGRSRFYDKRKEAIMIFGIALWGTAIPRFKLYARALMAS